MGQDVAATPERVVVRVGDNNSGALGGAGYHLIVMAWGHGSPRIRSEMFMCVVKFSIAIVGPLDGFASRANIPVQELFMVVT
jgi:hypothetical protein